MTKNGDAPYRVQKKPIFINLPFKGGALSNTVGKVSSKENTAPLDYSYSEKIKPFYVPNFGGINNDAVTCHCIDQFTCDCGSKYIGRTERIVKTRVSEHIYKWREHQINSPHPVDGNGFYQTLSIAKHLIEPGYKFNIRNSFKLIYKNRR